MSLSIDFFGPPVLQSPDPPKSNSQPNTYAGALSTATRSREKTRLLARKSEFNNGKPVIVFMAKENELLAITCKWTIWNIEEAQSSQEGKNVTQNPKIPVQQSTQRNDVKGLGSQRHKSIVMKDTNEGWKSMDRGKWKGGSNSKYNNEEKNQTSRLPCLGKLAYNRFDQLQNKEGADEMEITQDLIKVMEEKVLFTQTQSQS
ncbi:hypothetical protein HAX54_000889 [Datura stramonium]|uniref:Uncharacterized protein n=1 Tax=Datura stramonium TaxID=4076 RepID=A0ABS8T2E5_DATST|nr:hypothetical protein [Datura stramonium]